jgi:uncharacterized protein (DUF2384 family)
MQRAGRAPGKGLRDNRRNPGDTLGDEDAARAWLKRPHALLGGECPLARLDTEPGLREVEDMLTTIDETAAA